MHTANLLRDLSNLDALPGQEGQVQEKLKASIHTPSVQDAFGNVYFGDVTTQKKKVAVYAHMDEVGFFVQRITEQGFVYFYPIGAWSAPVILGQKVRATCRKNGKIMEGVVGTLPPKGYQGKEPIPMEELYIDFGATSKAELVEYGLQIGDMILPNVTADRSFNQKMIQGKALDNRVGCAIMAQVINQLSTEVVEVIGVATVQEEAGTRGSQVAAKKVDADINIVLDVANGKDTPKAAAEPTRILGKGPGLVLADKTALANLKLLDYVQAVAQKHQIPWQYDLLAGGGTDAGSIQLLAGKPTLVMCIPVRYCHSWYSLVQLSDVEATIQLIQKVIEALDTGGEQLDSF